MMRAGSPGSLNLGGDAVGGFMEQGADSLATCGLGCQSAALQARSSEFSKSERWRGIQRGVRVTQCAAKFHKIYWPGR